MYNLSLYWLISLCSAFQLKAGGEGDDKGWDGWMTSLTQWTWVWVNSRSWWWTGRSDVLQSMGSQRVRHYWVTELNWKIGNLVKALFGTMLSWYAIWYQSLLFVNNFVKIFLYTLSLLRSGNIVLFIFSMNSSIKHTA